MVLLTLTLSIAILVYFVIYLLLSDINEEFTAYSLSFSLGILSKWLTIILIYILQCSHCHGYRGFNPPLPHPTPTSHFSIWTSYDPHTSSTPTIQFYGQMPHDPSLHLGQFEHCRYRSYLDSKVKLFQLDGISPITNRLNSRGRLYPATSKLSRTTSAANCRSIVPRKPTSRCFQHTRNANQWAIALPNQGGWAMATSPNRVFSQSLYCLFHRKMKIIGKCVCVYLSMYHILLLANCLKFFAASGSIGNSLQTFRMGWQQICFHHDLFASSRLINPLTDKFFWKFELNAMGSICPISLKGL